MVIKDPAEVAKSLRKAAELGNAKAQYGLALLYASGQGVRHSVRQALAWYLKAAEQGFAPAQCILGNKYAAGQGVPQDYRKAVFWYLKAASRSCSSFL